jgi:hypothetical protein
MFALCLAWKDINSTRVSGRLVEYPPNGGEQLFHVPVRSPNQVCG